MALSVVSGILYADTTSTPSTYPIQVEIESQNGEFGCSL
jgi:hypothetical protein